MAAIVAAVPAAGLAPATLHAAPKPKLSIGALRRDGILVPFASYDGHWKISWPLDAGRTSIPISLDDVPAKWWGAGGRNGWQAWLAGGSTTAQHLALLRPIVFRAFCSTLLGVATDYHGEPADPRAPTVPKDGMAVAGDVVPLPIDTVAPDSPDARRISAGMVKAFDFAEDLAADAFTHWKHPLSPEERHRYPITLEAMYRAREPEGDDPYEIAYVEAVRKFPPAPEDKGCGLITYEYGWVTTRRGEDPKYRLAGRVTYCDREGVSFMQPFGRLRLDGDTYWVYQLSSWRDEIYGITRVAADRQVPVVLVSGGACPQ